METKVNWDKTMHDFGVSQLGNVTTNFKYLGDLDLSSTDFSVSCGCTSPTYIKETKTLVATLNLSEKGLKSSYIQSIKTEDKLLLKAEVK